MACRQETRRTRSSQLERLGTTMSIGWINGVIDGMTNQRSRAFVLCPLVLEPRLHLSFGELKGKGEDFAIGRKKIVLLLEPLLEDLDLFWSKPHSTPLWTIATVRLVLMCTMRAGSRSFIKFFVVMK